MKNQIRVFLVFFLYLAFTLSSYATPISSIGDFVWDDRNRDGIQDPSESGIDGVTVKLWDNSGVLATTTTSGSGSYLFDNIGPSDTDSDAISYTVEFITPDGYVASPRQQGSDPTLDSDATFSDGIFLSYEEDDLTVDAGFFYTLAGLGDFVWHDTDSNGIQDLGEPGVGGVSVNLYNSVTSILIGSTATDASGFFMFTGLAPAPNDYFLEFILPVAFDAFTAANQGSDPSIDSDAILYTSGIARTGVISLFSGAVDPTWDAGLIGDIQQVPEPTTLALLGLGLAGIAFRRKKSS